MTRTSSTDTDVPADDLRARILAAAADLIAAGGPEAATTRAVASAAAVQPPTIYRLFGDKSRLLEAVAMEVLAAYVAQKAARAPHPDPIEDLRVGWDMHVDFGLSHPGVFAILSGPRPSSPVPPATAAGEEILRARIRRIAAAGRLRVSEERAVALLQAAGTGTVLQLLRVPCAHRDLGVSELAREAVISAITGEAVLPADAGPCAAATALKASLDRTEVLTPGERHLLEELLDRLADGTERGKDAKLS